VRLLEQDDAPARQALLRADGRSRARAATAHHHDVRFEDCIVHAGDQRKTWARHGAGIRDRNSVEAVTGRGACLLEQQRCWVLLLEQQSRGAQLASH
jgi:hypothetical protein